MSVVGKYRYQMLSPHEHNRVPVLVDIILVGRTKIITLHSGMWIDNRTDKDLTFRLHVPITPLTAPAAGSTGARSDTIIGPVHPEKGESTARVSCQVKAHAVWAACCQRLHPWKFGSQKLDSLLQLPTEIRHTGAVHSRCMLQ